MQAGLRMTLETLKVAAFRLAPAVFAAGLAHLAFQIVKHWDVVTLDFRFFWLAGEFWTSGLSPYDEAYAAQADAQFGVTQGGIWYYAPNWLPLAAVMSIPDALTASRIWLMTNAGMLLGGCAFSVAAYRKMSIASPVFCAGSRIGRLLTALPDRTLYFLLAGAAALAQASANTLHLGQCSILVFFGASMLIYAAAASRLFLAAAALALVMLKPQIGILICAGLAFTPFGRRTVALAAVISILAAAPVFAFTPMPDFAADFAGGVAQYTDQPYNTPPAVTGLRHLAWTAGAADMGSAFYLLLALALVVTAGIHASTGRITFQTTDFIAAAIAIAAMASPLHVYDLTLLAPIALYAFALPAPAAAVSLASFAVILRAGNLPYPAGLLRDGITYYPGSLHASLAAIAIAAAVIWSAAEARRGALTPIAVAPPAQAGRAGRVISPA